MKTVAMLGKDRFRIQFSYDPAIVAQMRCLPPGRRWAPELHAWVCIASPAALGQLRQWGFDITPAVAAWEQQWLHPTAPAQVPIDKIAGLKHPLYPFQAEGVGFIESRGGRVLIGDEMGLGKTVQALAWLQHKGNPALPAVVVCPASLKGNWARECGEWTTLSPRILSGTVPDRTQLGGDVVIINYDILAHWLPLLGATKTVVLDEVHLIKNMKAARTKATRALCKGKRHVIALSGTPIINRPAEFFTTLNILDHDMFDKWWDYARQYCDATFNGFGWDISGASNTDELYHKLNGTIMLRRLKADVLTDLPPKTRTLIPLALDGSIDPYSVALREAHLAWGNEKTDPLADITQISKLRQAALLAKFDLCCEWISNFLETGRKIVVFDIHHKTTDRLMERYSKIAVALDGRVDSRIRSKMVERFQTDPSVQMLIGNVQVAGTGFTMTAAQDAVFLEFPWTPGELDQAEDRIHRIGQKGAANIYYLVAQGTLEVDMLELINEKRKVVAGVLDGVYDESTSILAELTKRLKQKGR